VAQESQVPARNAVYPDVITAKEQQLRKLALDSISSASLDVVDDNNIFLIWGCINGHESYWLFCFAIF
jgi:hypothetical protein